MNERSLHYEVKRYKEFLIIGLVVAWIWIRRRNCRVDDYVEVALAVMRYNGSCNV